MKILRYVLLACLALVAFLSPTLTASALEYGAAGVPFLAAVSADSTNALFTTGLFTAILGVMPAFAPDSGGDGGGPDGPGDDNAEESNSDSGSGDGQTEGEQPIGDPDPGDSQTQSQ